MTDLLSSDLTEFQIEQQTNTRFIQAFDLYQQIIKKMIQQPKLDQEQKQFLYKMIDGVNSSQHLFEIFVNWKDQRIPQSVSKYVGNLLDEMKKIDFGKSTKMPDNIPDVLSKLNQLKKQLEQKIIDVDIVKTSNLQINKYNDLLQQIIDKSPEQKESVLKYVMQQEEQDQTTLMARIQTIEGSSPQKSLIVVEYYKYRKEMIIRFFNFCNLLEKKLTNYIKQFHTMNKTSDHVNVIKSQYEKFKITITNLISNGVVNQTVQTMIDEINPSYTLIQFQDKMKQLGTKIIQDYLKDDRFSQAMTIITQINGLEITQDQILFDLILPSIIFSQIKLQFTINMSNEQYKEIIDELSQKTIIYQDLTDENDKKTYIEAFRQKLLEFLNFCYDVDRNALNQQQQLSQYKQYIQSKDKPTTSAELAQYLLNLVKRFFGNAISLNNVQDLKRTVQNANDNQMVQYIGKNLIFNAIPSQILNSPDLSNIKRKLSGEDYQKIQQWLQYRNTTNTGLKLIDNTINFAADNMVYYFNSFGLDFNKYKTYQQNQQTSSDKGLVLQYITNKEDIVMKLTSQAIDAIYSTLLISLQSLQTSPNELSIAQIIGGASDNKKIIPGAEMFYQLFAAATLIIIKHFKDNENDQQLNLKIQLPYESKFKQVFEYILQRQSNISQPDFQQYVDMLNKIWNSSNESTTRQNNNISQRTKSLLQDFMNDLMKGLTFSYGQSEQINQSGLNNIQVYKDIVQTTGFEENFVNTNNVQNNQYVEKIFTQMPKYSTTFNDKYQQLVSILENMILKQEDNYNFDDKEFSYYVKQYYDNVNYQENARERYVYDEFNSFVSNILNGKMSNTFTPTFLNDFGLLYYYYLVYVSNVFDILSDYHRTMVDQRVLENSHPFKPDLSDFDFDKKLTIYQRPLFQAIFATTYDNNDSLFQSFYETIKNKEISAGVVLDSQILKDGLKGKTAQEKFFYLINTYGMCKDVAQNYKSMQKGDLLPERLDYLWQQYQYIINSKQKQIAYMLNLIMTNNENEYELFEKFINVLKKNKIFNEVFKPIDEQTVKIGKITITICTNIQNANDGKVDVGGNIPQNNNQAIYVSNLDKWTGEGNNMVHLTSNKVGVKDQLSKKYYLNENYENILVNWFYPDYIYPFNLEDHADIQKRITQQIPFVKYNDKGFEFSKLIEFLQETSNNIIQKFDQFSTGNDTIKVYYKTQLQQSIDVSGMIQSIFNKKIIPPCNIQTFKQNYMKLQPINYEASLNYKFKYSKNRTDPYPDLFSYENIYNQEVSGVVMPGMDKKSIPIKTKTYFFDEIVVDDNKHSDTVFEINRVNQILHDTLQIFTCNNSYKKLPKDIVEKFLSNKYIKEQITLKDIKYQDFLVNVPINGFHTPFSLPNIRLENIKTENFNNEIQGGLKSYTSEQIDLSQNESLIQRSDVILINTCLKLLNKPENSFFDFYKKQERQQLYNEALNKILSNPYQLCNLGNLLMSTTWKQIETLLQNSNKNNILNAKQDNTFNQYDVIKYMLLFIYGRLQTRKQQRNVLQVDDWVLQQMNDLRNRLNLGAVKSEDFIGNRQILNGIYVHNLITDPTFQDYRFEKDEKIIYLVNQQIKKLFNGQYIRDLTNIDIANELAYVKETGKVLKSIQILVDIVNKFQQQSTQLTKVSVIEKMKELLFYTLSQIPLQETNGQMTELMSDQDLIDLNILGMTGNQLRNKANVMLNGKAVYTKIIADYDLSEDLTMYNLSQVAKAAVQSGIIDIQIGNNQNTLIILAQLLQKIYNTPQNYNTFGDNDPIYFIQNNKIEFFQQTYKTIDIQNMDLSQLQKTINSVFQQINQTKDKSQGILNIFKKYMNILEKNEILQYFQNTTLFTIDLDEKGLFEKYFIDDIPNVSQDIYRPSYKSTYQDFQIMTCVLLLRSLLLYQQQNNYMTHELLINLDIIGNYINILNARQALQPLLQGQLLSQFVELAVNNILNLYVQNISFRIVHLQQKYREGGLQGFPTSSLVCLVYLDDKFNGLNSLYNGQGQQDPRTYNIELSGNTLQLYNQNEINAQIPQTVHQLYGGVIKSDQIYKTLNQQVDGYDIKIVGFQQGVPYDVYQNRQLNLQKIYINVPIFGNDAMGKLLQNAAEKRIQQILLETQQMMYIFNDKKQQIEKYDEQNTVKNEFYQGRLIHMSNAYALNKVDDRQYTLLDRQIITQKLYETNLKKDIQQILQYYTVSEQSKSILQTTQNIIQDFMKENYELLKTDKEYVKMYDEYTQQYKVRMQKPEQMFNLDIIFDDKNQSDRFAFWMGLEADYYIEDENTKFNDNHAQFKKLWLQMRNLKKIKKIPYQKAKMYFTRYTDNTNRYIGHDHYFQGDVQLQDVYSYDYNDNVVEGAPNGISQEKSDLIYKSNLNQLFKLQTPEIQNMSEQMHQLIYYKTLGLANDNGKLKYSEIKLTKLIQNKNLQLRSVADDTSLNIEIIPFKLINVGGIYHQIFNDVKYSTLNYFNNIKPDYIFLYNSLYAYSDVEIKPLILAIHLQLHSGISEQEITRPATTFGISVMPITTNDQQYAYIEHYFSQLNSCLQNKLVDISSQNKQIIGINPINAISLIKNNISFPIINILSLFLRSYMRRELIGKQKAGQGTKEYVFQQYILEDNDFVLGNNVITDIKPKQNSIKNPSRYLQHMISNSALFLIKAREKRVSLNQQYQIQNYKITLDSKQDVDF